MGVGRFILGLMGVNTTKPVDDLSRAVNLITGSPLVEVPIEKGHRYADFEYSKRFRNDRMSIFYIRTIRPDGVLVETLDMIGWKRVGGIILTTYDGNLVDWTRDGSRVPNPPYNPDIARYIKIVLRHVRMAAGETV